MGFEVLFYFFKAQAVVCFVSHFAAFLVGMWVAISANGKRAMNKGVCACHPGDDVYVYSLVRE